MPCCHSSASIVSPIHLDTVGSRNASETLATTRAPAQLKEIKDALPLDGESGYLDWHRTYHATCGSTKSLQMGVASGLT